MSRNQQKGQASGRGAKKPSQRRGGGRRSSSNRNRRRKAKVAGKKFWGQHLPDEQLAEIAPIRVSRDPGAVLRSLGPPPLPGREQVAPHYLDAVAERAANLAGALAAAGGLYDSGDDD